MSIQGIETVIHNVLKGEAQKNALDFVTCLNTNEMSIEGADSYWEVKYKDKCVCFLWVNGSDEKPGPWTIWSNQEPGTWAAWPDEKGDSEQVDYPVDENLKKVAWANVNFCENCGGDCSPGRSKIVLGKKFDNLCSSTMAFTNPDIVMVNCAKKMVEIRKNDILKEI